MTNLTNPGQLGDDTWAYDSTTFLTGGYTGTEGKDTKTFGTGEGGLISMLGGHDTATLKGSDAFVVDLGAGYDKLHLGKNTDYFARMDVHADGGAGGDKFYIYHAGDYHIDGGAGVDTVDFNDLEDGLWYLPMSVEIYYTGQNAATVHNVYDDDGHEMTATLINVERIVGTGNSDNAYGADFDDWFDGQSGWDFFDGGDGNDTFLGRRGYDVADMGAGDDKAYGGAGHDTLSGGEGDDMLSGNAGEDDLDGGSGNDTIWGGDDTDNIRAGDGDDWIDAGAGDDFVQVYQGTQAETDGNDQYKGGDNSNDSDGKEAWGDVLSFAGLKGGVEINMSAETASGRTTASAKMGVDRFEGFETFEGTAYADLFHARDGDVATFFGFNGDDKVMAVQGDYAFFGGSGFDTIDFRGSDGAVSIDLGAKTAVISDSETGAEMARQHVTGFEKVVGSAFSDLIIGDAKDNRLKGGEGADYLLGKEGADSFVFDGAGDYDYDHVMDFQSGEDKLVLNDMVTNSGVDITGFSVLDENNDGVLTNGEGGFYSWENTGYLMAQNAIIELSGVTSLQADDFIFG